MCEACFNESLLEFPIAQDLAFRRIWVLMEPCAPATAKEAAVPLNQAREVKPRRGVQCSNREVGCVGASRVHVGPAIVGLAAWLR